ncbi:MAG: alkaline phosphatase family protein [Desulfovibrionaceae bacterium]
MPQQCIMILLDGLGDRAYARFGHRTPLDAAATPHLDHLAALGANGLYHAASFGLALPSENAHFSLFGYDLDDFPGRGALEALGADVPLEPGDVAVLAHLCHVVDDNGALRCAKDVLRATPDEARQLAEAVAAFETDGVAVRFHTTKGLFGVLVLRGDALGGGIAPHVTDSNPMTDGRLLSDIVPRADHAHDPACRRTARVLRRYLRWAFARLADHPVNAARAAQGAPPATGLVTQRAGQLRAATPFAARYGMGGLSIASGVLFRGLARYLGMDSLAVADSDDPGRDLAERIALAHARLPDYGFIHVHTKAPDQAAHTKSPEAKRDVIARLDAALGKAVPPLLDDPDVLLVVTSDHSTPSGGRLVHSGEPVPLLFVGRGVRRDGVTRFGEVAAAGGALGCLRGRECMDMILNHLDRSRLQGIHDTPQVRDYWPGDYAPLRLADPEDA